MPGVRHPERGHVVPSPEQRPIDQAWRGEPGYRHSASSRAFTPVFDGLWTRVNALMAHPGYALAIAVDVGEGCAMEAMINTHIFISGICNAMDLLLDLARLKATLRTR